MRRAIFSATLLLFFSATFSQPSKGKSVPEVLLPDTNGKNIALSSLQGKIVLIDFWASWCHPCRQNNIGLRELYEKYKTKGFEIYSISLDNDTQSWLQAIKGDEINWITVIDASEKIANDWTISFIPQSFLIDKTGKVIAVDEDENKLDRILKKLLE